MCQIKRPGFRVGLGESCVRPDRALLARPSPAYAKSFGGPYANGWIRSGQWPRRLFRRLGEPRLGGITVKLAGITLQQVVIT